MLIYRCFVFYRIKAIKTIDNYKLLVTFFNDEVKEYNVGIWFDKNQEFKVLSNTTGLFEQVKVDAGGCGISWNDNLDLFCNELYFNSMPIS